MDEPGSRASRRPISVGCVARLHDDGKAGILSIAQSRGRKPAARTEELTKRQRLRPRSLNRYFQSRCEVPLRRAGQLSRKAQDPLSARIAIGITKQRNAESLAHITGWKTEPCALPSPRSWARTRLIDNIRRLEQSEIRQIAPELRRWLPARAFARFARSLFRLQVAPSLKARLGLPFRRDSLRIEHEPGSVEPSLSRNGRTSRMRCPDLHVAADHPVEEPPSTGPGRCFGSCA